MFRFLDLNQYKLWLSLQIEGIIIYFSQDIERLKEVPRGNGILHSLD